MGGDATAARRGLRGHYLARTQDGKTLAALLADAPTPAQPAAPQGGDVEALAEALAAHEYALGVRRGGICSCGFVPTIERDALTTQQEHHRAHVAAILASDWLAAHDAEVRASAARETAERIAGAIEAEAAIGFPEIYVRKNDAARIARAEGDR